MNKRSMPFNNQIFRNKVVCIHQPDFFPWMGVFDKIIRSDAFVILDHVQFPKGGGAYCNRVKLLVGGGEHWVTAPIIRNYQGFRAINEMEFQSAILWREKILKTISYNYCRAPFFKETLEIIESLIANPENNVALYNANAVLAIADLLSISKEKFYWSSQLPHVGSATKLLISLTRAVNGGTYMCGSGAVGYQEDAAFAATGIGLVYQNFQHPVYPQIGAKEFVPGLSVIDALMNIGVAGVRAALHIA